MRSLAITSRSPEETRILGASLAPVLLPGDVISLNGDLGAGKTVFVQGLATALGTTVRVTSPAFTIVHEYDARWPILHIDVYRLNSYQEVIDLGFEELLDPGAILVVEWGEAVAPLLPRRYLEIVMRRPADADSDDLREMTFRPHGGEWPLKLDAMRTTAETLLDAASHGLSTESRFVDAGDPPARDHMKPEDLGE
ncbi:MAG TPA: tRNA (adenosine(37)-N6)-threonylcarbamoyltransferase complex ATPase subunit type 1 TsaE [Actinomycetota bacterium]|jgi:tRNA threonylcarbamoyladenosine biosynthesis protein TsaE